MAAIQLTPAERKRRRAEANHIGPVVIVGAHGATAAVSREIDQALASHGLIKIRVLSDDRGYRHALFESLANELSAAAIQHIGKSLVLWRPVPARPSSQDEARMGAPRVVKIVKFSKSANHRPQIKTVTLLGNQRVAAGGAIKRVKRRSTLSTKKGT
jgi:putative YhbY family RNA-binding protein